MSESNGKNVPFVAAILFLLFWLLVSFLADTPEGVTTGSMTGSVAEVEELSEEEAEKFVEEFEEVVAKAIEEAEPSKRKNHGCVHFGASAICW